MPSGLITTGELAELIAAESPAILDVRGNLAYLKGHIPGSVATRWQEFCDPSHKVKGMLHPDHSVLAAGFSDLGVAVDRPVVLVSEPFENWGAEGRFFWMLHMLGHDDIRVLDGGYPKWRDEGRATAMLPTRPRTVKFVPNLRTGTSIDRDGVAACMNGAAPGTVVVDTRGADEFADQGHVPGAVNLPWSAMYRNDGTFLLDTDLLPMLEKAGISPDKEIVPYCTGGVRSAVVFMVLHLKGYPKVKNYDGSWWEWTHHKMPVSR
ncbi:MAG: sulfurtransferase [Nitrospirota bacterium]|nr:sulfurtransferase [Nitrospirota bacterium]